MKSTRKTPRSSLTIARPASLTSTVVARLKSAIIDAEFPLGSELSELGLAATFGVSRTPVREALSTLQLQGMVDIIPQKGSYVFFPTEQDLVDLCDHRVMLEQRAVQLSFKTQKDQTAAALSDAVDAMAQARATGDAIGYSQADARFHETLFDHCSNRYLQEAYQLVAGRIATLRTHLSALRQEIRDLSFQEHEEILDHFKAGEMAMLDAVLVFHIKKTRDTYVAALRGGVIGSRQSPVSRDPMTDGVRTSLRR